MTCRWMGIMLVMLVAAVPSHSDDATKAARPPAPAGSGPRLDFAGDPLPAGARWRLGSIRLVAGGAVDFLAFSPDGKRILAGGQQIPLSFWDATTGKPHPTPNLPAIHASVSIQAQMLMEAGGGRFIQRNQIQPQSPHVAMAGKVCFFCDDKGNGHLLDLTGPKLLRSWPMGENAPASITVTANGTVAWATAEGDLVLHNPLGKDSPRKRKLDPMPIVQMAFSPDGKLLATTHPDGSFLLSRVEDGKRIRRYPLEVCPTTFLGFSADGKTIVASDSQAVHLFDVDSLDERETLTQPDVSLDQVAWVTPGKSLATLHSSGVVHVWDVATRKILRKLTIEEKKHDPRHGNETTCLAISPDGLRIATGNAQGLIEVWDGKTGKVVLPAPAREPIFTAGFDSAGKAVIVVYPKGVKRYAASDGSLRRFQELVIEKNGELALAPNGQVLGMLHGGVFSAVDLVSGKKLPPLAPPAVAQPAPAPLGAREAALAARLALLGGDRLETQRFLFHPDSKHVLIARGDPNLFLFDVATGKQQACFPVNHNGSPILISDDGRTLYLVINGRLEGFEMVTGKKRLSLEVQRRFPMDVSYDGRRFVLNSGSDLFLMDALQGEKFTILTEQQQRYFSFATISPDGEWLAAGGSGQGFFLWETATGRLRAHQTDGAARISRLVFSPTGKEFMTTSDDGTLLLWDLAEVLNQKQTKPAPLPAARPMAALWADLASADGLRAEAAIRDMARCADTERFLAKHLQPVATVSPAVVDHLIADLEADTASVRDAAAAGLATLEEQARPALERAAKGKLPETRARAGRLLARLRPFGRSPAQARPLRAIEVLERRGTPPARRLLTQLSRGAAESIQTREAYAALDRLKRRRGTEP